MHDTTKEARAADAPSSEKALVREVVSSIDVRRRMEGRHIKRAAVSAIFDEDSRGQLHLLFIQRASDPNDPWSGHMAFPGGRVEATDANTRAAAERETREEVGLCLRDRGTWVGRLSDVRALARGQMLPLIITPHVYTVNRRPPLVCNYEVADALWVPFSYLLDRTNVEEMDYTRGEFDMKLPCYRYEGKVIWGLTLQMLSELIEAWPR